MEYQAVILSQTKYTMRLVQNFNSYTRLSTMVFIIISLLRTMEVRQATRHYLKLNNKDYWMITQLVISQILFHYMNHVACHGIRMQWPVQIWW